MTATSAAHAQQLQWNGFALARVTSAPSSGPLQDEKFHTEAQLGIDWTPNSFLLAHLHLIARQDESDSDRGAAGTPEAYVDARLQRKNGDRIRLRAGAFFLPTSRENVDALWESAYTITPSALNSWFGEEFRPIGVDASYSHRGFSGGATLFRGNDTFGALPPARGWRMRDHWIVLGEHLHVDPEYVTSVSAETDGRLGWSARAGWSGQRALVQLTHIDNRSDALDHGALFNWHTRFDVAAFEYDTDQWTVAAESGWGPTVIIVDRPYTSDLRASYLLVSRLMPHGRATLRFDEFANGVASERTVTAAFLWSPRGPLRPAIELIRSTDDTRATVELRYRFGGS